MCAPPCVTSSVALDHDVEAVAGVALAHDDRSCLDAERHESRREMLERCSWERREDRCRTEQPKRRFVGSLCR